MAANTNTLFCCSRASGTPHIISGEVFGTNAYASYQGRLIEVMTFAQGRQVNRHTLHGAFIAQFVNHTQNGLDINYYTVLDDERTGKRFVAIPQPQGVKDRLLLVRASTMLKCETHETFYEIHLFM